MASPKKLLRPLESSTIDANSKLKQNHVMQGELILIVDDEVHIVELAKMYLEREGFRVSAVGDGQAALDRLDEAAPGLIVLDLMLPIL